MNRLRAIQFHPIQIAAIALFLVVTPLTLNAQDVCPCVPLTKLWVSTVCDSWNCAMAALVNANGDPAVFAMPVAMNDGRWLVIRQVASGSYIDNSPFQVESFDGVSDATARFSAITTDLKPRIMSAPDGRFLVISLRQPEPAPTRRHAVGH